MRANLLSNMRLVVPAVALFFSAQILADVEQARLDAVAADLQARIDDGKLSGAVVMVAQDGEVLMHEAMGYQNVEDKVPMSTDTIFRIFSMTKPVTGTALMMLWDEGKFELDDPVEMHLPELAGMRVLVQENDDGSWNTEPAEHPMTIRELMSHTGGLTYFPPLGSGSIADAYVESGIGEEATLAESIPNLANIPLLNQPGAKWVYSISVDVQGYLIERLSGQTLDSFFQERIFDPLGMVDTGFFVHPENHHRLSRMYMPSGERLIRTDNSPEALGGAFTEKPKFLAGGHGLVSTSTDYMKFATLHLSNGVVDEKRLLSQEALNLMHNNQLPENIEAISPVYPGNVFGLDFAIVDNSEVFQGTPTGTFWWWGIAGSWFWVDPQNKTIFIGMIQNNDLRLSFRTHAATRNALYN